MMDQIFKPSRMKFVDTSVLRVGYQEWNETGTRSVILLHGWPDSPRTWSQVAPGLAQAGWRVIVPALRGFAPTTFLENHTPRSGQLVALGCDVLELIERLNLVRPALVGHDWGARAAALACALRAGVASHLVLMSVAYGTQVPTQHLSLQQARHYWYHWYMTTPRGQQEVQMAGHAFAQFMWDTWSPAGWYTQQEFDETALAFDHPDWSAVTLHSYQHRWGHAQGDPRYDEQERKLTQVSALDVPTLVLHGEVDGVNPVQSSSGQEHLFLNRYERVTLPGVGHFPSREDAPRVVHELVRFLST